MKNLRVSLASPVDEGWLLLHESKHIASAIVREKIQRHEYILATAASKPVGYLRLSYFWSFIPYIDVIWVEEPFRKQGIGTAMLNFLEELACNRGQQIVMSSSQTDEAEPQAWHRKVGFQDAGALINLQPIQDVTEVIFIKHVSSQ